MQKYSILYFKQFQSPTMIMCLRTESFLKPFGLQDLRIFLHPVFSPGCDEKLTVFEQSPHNWWVEDGHHRIHSECGLCCIEDGLREHSSVFQYMSGDWRGTLWTLLVTFCIVIIRCTETFWSPCIYAWQNHQISILNRFAIRNSYNHYWVAPEIHRAKRRASKNMETEWSLYSSLSLIHGEKSHSSLKLLNLWPGLYILMQKVVILNTCCIVQKFLAV